MKSYKALGQEDGAGGSWPAPRASFTCGASQVAEGLGGGHQSRGGQTQVKRGREPSPEMDVSYYQEKEGQSPEMDVNKQRRREITGTKLKQSP